eukprot:s39_g35.t1
MFCKSEVRIEHLQQSGVIDLWSPGVTMKPVAPYGKSCKMCSRYTLYLARLLQSFVMEVWSLGVIAGQVNSSAIQEQLQHVQQIQASSRSFAAILCDGSVVSWGDPEAGGGSSAVQEKLKDVKQIQASDGGAFAAIRGDGSVAWGYPMAGGDSSAVQEQLNLRMCSRSRLLFEHSLQSWEMDL